MGASDESDESNVERYESANENEANEAEHAIDEQEQEQDVPSDNESESEGANGNDSEEKNDSESENKKLTKKPYQLSLEKTEDFNAKLRKRGVIFLARVPPRMGPTKIKQILSDFGIVTRIYLEPEDKAAKKRRQRATGSKSGGKRYKEGWIEYEEKKVAKRVASSLNNTAISNQKGSVHYGDLWSMKYLSKFQWAHLTEKVAYERRMREQKLRIEMVHARRENQAYSNLVEAGKVMDRIENRRKKRKVNSSSATASESNGDAARKTRKFKQTKPVSDNSDKRAKKSVLGSLV